VTIKELLPLARRLAKHLCDAVNVDPSVLEPIVFEQKFFADGELMSRKPIDAFPRGTRAIYLDCPRFPTINDGVINTAFTLEALAASGVSAITHIMLFAPYARQDKRKPGEPLSWKIIMNFFRNASRQLDRLVAVELHTEQHEQALEGLQLVNVRGHNIFAQHFASEYRHRAKECIVVSPDASGAPRAEKFEDNLFTEVLPDAGYFRKRRPKDNVAETLSYTGPDPRDKIVFIYDDMIDTGGTDCGATKLLKERGAKKIIVVAMHGLFNKTAISDLSASGVDQIVVSESVPRTDEWLAKHKGFVTQVTLDEILANVILEQRPGGSASRLFL
jgi:ribose-phosphate pyrophosphokinase